MPNAQSADWKKIKAEYVSGKTSYRQLVEKYGVSFSAICRRGKKENWTDLRKQTEIKTSAKIVESVSNKQAERAQRITSVADRLLDKIEQAIAELDLTIATQTTKVKEIEYNNEERPDKPTKEVITECQHVDSVQTIVDRAGLKAIASALRDLKEVQDIKSPADEREQEARIEKLRKDAQREDKQDNSIKVIIGSGLDDYAN